MSEAYFTKALGIAPITQLPKFVKIARIDATDPEAALAKLRRAHPNLVRPYWKMANRTLCVVVETDEKALKVAMGNTYPFDAKGKRL